jgi:hypothetical protein
LHEENLQLKKAVHKLRNKLELQTNDQTQCIHEASALLNDKNQQLMQTVQALREKLELHTNE